MVGIVKHNLGQVQFHIMRKNQKKTGIIIKLFHVLNIAGKMMKQ